MKRIGLISILAAAALTTACVMFPPSKPKPQLDAPSPEAVLRANPPHTNLEPPAPAESVPAETPQASTPAAGETTACHIERYQGLIGQPISSVDQTTLPPQHRVICMGCMATMDFSAERLTIQLGPNNVVASMRCG